MFLSGEYNTYSLIEFVLSDLESDEVKVISPLFKFIVDREAEVVIPIASILTTA